MSSEDSVSVDSCKSGDSFGPMIVSGLMEVPWKMMAILAVLYILLNSDVCIERVISKMEGAVEFGAQPSTYGVVIMALIFVMFYAVFDIMVRKNVL